MLLRPRDYRPSSSLFFIFLALISCRSSSHYVEQGDRDSSVGLFDDAVIEYRKALQKDTGNGQAFYGLGLAEGRRGNTLQALKALTAARDLLPDREDIQTQLVSIEMATYLADPTHPNRLYEDLQRGAERFLAKNAKSYEGIRTKALLAWTDGKLKDAIELFQAADREKPGHADLIASWCQVLFQDGQFEEGERRALGLIRAQPHFRPIYDGLAGAYHSRGQRNKALDIIRMKVANNPDRIEDGIQLASWYSRYGDKEKMKAELDRLVDIFPNARLNVGDFYFDLQDWPEAIHVYQEGAGLSPRRRIDYLKRLCDAWLAQGNVQEAAKDLNEILKVSPQDDLARVVNDSLLVSNGSADKAIPALNDLGDIVRRNPDKPVWRLTYALTRLKAGDVDGAAREFHETLRLRPDLLQPRIVLAQIAQQKGDYRQTLQYADEILAVRPDLLEARFQRTAGLIGTRQYGVARLELTSLVRQIPDNPEVEFQLASLDRAESNFRGAEARLRKLAENSQTRSRALKGLIDVYTASNQRDKAYEMFSTELAMHPDSEEMRSTTAELALRAGKYDDAFHLYQELVQRYPQSALYLKLLGGASQLRGDMPAAIASYEKAVALAPSDPATLSVLANALVLVGRANDAIAV